MPQPLALAPAHLLTMPHAAFGALRAALLRDVGGNYATYLQEAAYAGGEAQWASFAEWLAARGEGAPESLGLERFRSAAAEYFSECGWGAIGIGQEGAVATVDAPDWHEADPAAQLPWPGCYYGTGMLADFFGRVAGEPLGAMEVECRSAGHAHCRWLVGSADVLGAVYDAMAGGASWDEAVRRLG